MGHATETLEHAEHTAHAGHGHGGGDNSLGMRVGITMAFLGVLLAFAAAKVGGERTELVKALVDQQHAHSKYQAQDVKHRVAVLGLRNLHAFAMKPGEVDPRDLVATADAVERYDREAEAARAWVEAYDPVVAAHTHGQEEYERAQLAAEFGIVIASIALLLRRRLPWLLAIVLGLVAVGLLGQTYLHVHHAVGPAEVRIEEAEHAYRELRAAGKTTDLDRELVEDVRRATKN